MKLLNKISILCLVVIQSLQLHAQVNISYTPNATICQDSAISFTAQGQGVNNMGVIFGSDWDIRNPSPVYKIKNYNSTFSNPAHIKFVKDSLNNYFAFINNYTGSCVRYSFGSSIYNTPTATNLGNFGGLLGTNSTGVEIQYENGKWYVFMSCNSNFIRLDFGSSLNNTPSVVNLTQAGKFSTAVEIYILKEKGNWYGFVANYSGAKQLTRIDFGSSISNSSPTMTTLGFTGTVISDFELTKDQATGKWYIFYSGQTSKTLTRVELGTNIANNSPSFTNLGNPNSAFVNVARGLLILKDCDQKVGYITDESSRIIRMDWSSGLAGTPTLTNLGSFGGLLKKSSFIGQSFVFHDSLFFPVINVGSDEYILFAMPLAGSPPYNAVFKNKAGTIVQNFTKAGTVTARITVNMGAANQFDTCVTLKTIKCKDTCTVKVKGNAVFCKGNYDLLSASKYFTNDTFYWYRNGKNLTAEKWDTMQARSGGWYKVMRRASGCSVFDSIFITMDSVAPKNTLDTALCPQAKLTLNAGLAKTYLWSPATGLSSNTIRNPLASPTTDITYQCTLTSANGCVGYHTSKIRFHKIIPFKIADSVAVCVNKQINIDAGPGFTNYNWSNGTKTRITQTGTAGWIYINANDSHNCKAKDSVFVTIKNYKQTISGIAAICKGSATVLHGIRKFVSDSFFWYYNNNPVGNVLIDSLKVKQAGKYKLISHTNLCIISDSIIVNVDSVILGPKQDTALCIGNAVKLNAGIAAGYYWFKGSGLSDTLMNNPIATPKVDNDYRCRLTSASGCLDTFTASIKIFYPKKISLKDSNILCPGVPVNFDIGTGYHQIRWSTGDTLRNLLCNTAGQINVSAKDMNNCATGDTAVVIQKNNPTLPYLFSDTTICKGELVSVFLPPVSGTNYSINPQQILTNNAYNFTLPGAYSIMAGNICGTVKKDITIKIKACDSCYFWLPKAFTPDENTRNDNYGLVAFCNMKKYDLKIFDRWGEMVFHTMTLSEKWDGTYIGKYAPEGVYIAVVSFENLIAGEIQRHVLKETFHLLR